MSSERKNVCKDAGIRPYVMLNLFQHLTASLYFPPSLGEILKQVQDDHLLWAIVICYIEENRIKSVCKDAKPEGRIAAGFQTRGIIDKIKIRRL